MTVIFCSHIFFAPKLRLIDIIFIKPKERNDMMLDSISEIVAERFYRLKLEHEAIVESMSQFSKYRITRNKKATLLTQKEQNLTELRKVKFEISQELVTTNIFKMKNNWFIIGQQKGKKRDFFLMGLKDEVTRDIVEDVFQGKLITNAGEKLKQYRDKKKYGEYRKEVANRAKEILLGLCEEKRLENSQTKDGFLFITEHAFLRWEERVVKEKKKTLTKELKTQREKEIREVFARAEKVYNQERTGRTYFLDKETMILFCVHDNTIISLWINDYGFSNEKINHEITLMQLAYLNDIKNELAQLREGNEKKKEKIKEENNNMLDSINSIENQIKSFEEQIKSLKEQISSTKKEICQKNKEIEGLKQEETDKFNQLKKEEAVLFSRFVADVGNGEITPNPQINHKNNKKVMPNLLSELTMEEKLISSTSSEENKNYGFFCLEKKEEKIEATNKDFRPSKADV